MALTLGSTGWLVSGLSPSPLVNSLLPALAALPALLPLPLRAGGGYGLQLAGAVALLGVSLQLTGSSVLWPLLAVLLFGIGGRMSRLPLQQQLLGANRASLQTLRLGDSLGQLLGNLLTGLLFPLGKAVLQYVNGLVLLLPLLPLALGSGQARKTGGSPRLERPAPPAPPIPLERRSTIQGLLFGSLFSLLALWVRQVGAGSCLDFGLVLTAYGLGRTLGSADVGPRLPQGSPYLLIAALLAFTQAPGLPGWGAVLLFVPMGVLAARSDGQLVASLTSLVDDEPLRWQILERSGAIGGLAGALAIGAVAQVVGLTWALPIQVGAFVAAAVLLHRQGGRPIAV